MHTADAAKVRNCVVFFSRNSELTAAVMSTEDLEKERVQLQNA